MLEKPIDLLIYLFNSTLNIYLYLMKLVLGKYYDELVCLLFLIFLPLIILMLNNT